MTEKGLVLYSCVISGMVFGRGKRGWAWDAFLLGIRANGYCCSFILHGVLGCWVYLERVIPEYPLQIDTNNEYHLGA